MPYRLLSNSSANPLFHRRIGMWRVWFSNQKLNQIYGVVGFCGRNGFCGGGCDEGGRFGFGGFDFAITFLAANFDDVCFPANFDDVCFAANFDDVCFAANFEHALATTFCDPIFATAVLWSTMADIFIFDGDSQKKVLAAQHINSCSHLSHHFSSLPHWMLFTSSSHAGQWNSMPWSSTWQLWHQCSSVSAQLHVQ